MSEFAMCDCCICTSGITHVRRVYDKRAIEKFAVSQFTEGAQCPLRVFDAVIRTFCVESSNGDDVNGFVNQAYRQVHAA
jgi:hypothetical protein